MALDQWELRRQEWVGREVEEMGEGGVTLKDLENRKIRVKHGLIQGGLAFRRRGQMVKIS